MEKIELLISIVDQIRIAFERIALDNDITGMEYIKNFPKGCCYDSSCTLGRILLDKGYETELITACYYESSEDPEIPVDNQVSHNWLEYERNVIIDLTIDQFKNSTGEIVTVDSSWHYTTFHIIDREDANTYLSQMENNYKLMELYRRIAQAISEN
ncbi:hypothetical protein [uncultured Sphaerochaeta sp.]|uniref:hypothetical protein n=1 Tax=uncultured Sphaerochaeta sp. TaxID=886478 RepID=UPI002AA801B6|nr:hypothetical protein [uncultured Sphaerochaeta sp.]